MPGPKRLPVEVVERAAALTKQYKVAPAAKLGDQKSQPAATLTPAAAKKTKLVAALKKLHPMD
ncbi:MAG: hypothetical protein JNK82_25980 [Myxococcaceae bacterium]|nr:hypothetical protein [Myxococcaceae bacterium]